MQLVNVRLEIMPDDVMRTRAGTHKAALFSPVTVVPATRVVSLRLLDQALWSSGFFLFNLAAAFALPVTTFAALAVSTTIGVIISAAIRAFTADGRLIAAARVGIGAQHSLSIKLSWLSTTVGSILAAGISAVWIYFSPVSGISWSICILAGAIVWADLPHYLLVLTGRYVYALSLGAAYSATAASALIYASQTGGQEILLGWLCVAVIIGSLGVTYLARLRMTSVKFEHLGITLRLAAESLYSSVGAQIGMLVIFLVADAYVTAGIRLAYSIVFAPVFMIVQGLQPIVLRRMAVLHEAGTGKEKRLAIIWTSACGTGLVLAGLLASIAASSIPWFEQLLAPSVPYLLPVGATMLGSLALDAALLVSRFKIHPKVPHRIRLATVSMEMAMQIGGILVGGAPGLVGALIVVGGAKFGIGVLMLILAPADERRGSSCHKESRDE